MPPVLAPPSAPAAPKPAPKAAPAAAPAKPAPKPAAAPPEKPAVVKPPEPGGGAGLDEAFSELDQLDIDSNKPRPGPAPKPAGKGKPPVKKAEGAEPNFEKPDETPEAKEGEAEPGAEVTPPGEAELEPQTNPELRKALDRAHVKLKTIEPELSKLKEKIKELESREPEEVGSLRKKSEQIEARNKELEDRMVYLDYQNSKEFKEKYVEPYLKAYTKTLREVQQLSVEMPDGKERKATEEDLLELGNTALGERFGKAQAMFGDAANFVLSRVEKLLDLSEAQSEALSDAQKNGLTRFKQTQEQERTAAAQRSSLWKTENERLAKDYPKFFAPVEGDKEGNDLLAKGFALADRVFAPDEETRPKTPEETVRLHALIRNKVANHDRMALLAKKYKARVAELEETLKQYEESEPQGGLGGPGAGGGGAGNPNDYEGEIDAMDAKSR